MYIYTELVVVSVVVVSKFNRRIPLLLLALRQTAESANWIGARIPIVHEYFFCNGTLVAKLSPHAPTTHLPDGKTEVSVALTKKAKSIIQSQKVLYITWVWCSIKKVKLKLQ